jgi:hypothetical protein
MLGLRVWIFFPSKLDLNRCSFILWYSNCKELSYLVGGLFLGKSGWCTR